MTCLEEPEGLEHRKIKMKAKFDFWRSERRKGKAKICAMREFTST